MKYRVKDIVKDILRTLEMNNESASLIEEDDIDTLVMNEVAESKILDAVKYIMMNASIGLVGYGKSIDSSIAWEGEEGKGVGYVTLPDDFMRLLTFRMTDWKTAARIINEDGVEYALQQSKHQGLRGNPESPVVAICHYPEGLTLELYTCVGGRDAAIRKASYLPLPSVDEYGLVDIPERLYSAVTYYAAYLVAISYSATSVANALLNQAMVMAGIQQSTPEPEQQQ